MTNPVSASISTFDVSVAGELTLAAELAYQAPKLKKYFMDLDLSAYKKYVNVVSGNTGEVFVFKILQDSGNAPLVGIYPGGAKIHTYGIVTISAK